LRSEYIARFFILFGGLEESNTIIIKMISSKKFSERGRSEMEVEAPFIPYNSNTRQKLSFISYNEYSTGIFKSIFNPD
jgi:IMP cyclohydrolase